MNKLFKGLLLSLALLLTTVNVEASQSTQPVESCKAFVPYGKPTDSKPHTQEVCRQAYYLEHDNVAKIPVWVAYTLSPEHTEGCVKRTDKFAPDQSLPHGQRAELEDYNSSGYDRGHIANDADMTWSVDTEKESLILSNMTPQLHGLNAGIWKDLETDVRAWAFGKGHTMLVYAGPIYDIKKDKTIGPNKVDIPSAFYKIVVDTQTKEHLAFIFPHQATSTGKIADYQVTVLEVEKETGIKFNIPGDKGATIKIWPANPNALAKDKAAVCHR